MNMAEFCHILQSLCDIYAEFSGSEYESNFQASSGVNTTLDP